MQDTIAARLDLCARAPKAPGPWVALAREYLGQRRAAEALAAAERALALQTLHAAARQVRNEAVQIIEATEPALARLELNAALEPDSAAAHLELAHAYVERDRPADAERCFKRTLDIDPLATGARAGLAATYLSVEIFDGAEYHARLALEGEPGHAVASQTLAAVLERNGDLAGASRVLDAAYARQSLFVEPAVGADLTVLVLATQTSGNIPYRHLLPPAQATRLIWYMEHARDSQAASLPQYDLVFNARGDPDLAEASAPAVDTFLSTNRRPVFNAPGKVARTRRDRIPALLGDIEGAVAPMALRLQNNQTDGADLADRILAAGLAYPFLVRPTGSHGGRGLEKVESDAELAAYAAASGPGDLYATAFHDYRALDGFFRKGRMIFVDRKPYPYHWAIAPDWLVHYDTAGMGGDAVRQAEERAFLADPESVIGAAAVQAITQIGQRLDLDYCGLDFSVLPDGRVLVFEANATMFVHPEDADSELAYKNAPVRRILDAFQARISTLARAD